MRLAEYVVGGEVRIVEAPEPALTPGGLIVETLACGLCSGELMSWYLDRKAPHVLGHEVCGKILASDDPRFPVGERVFVHHHAPCMGCAFCVKQAYVHCAQWKRTRLDPGGMAQRFAVGAENLNDAFLVPELTPEDAALIEPLACVVKCLRRAELLSHSGESCLIVGAGALGIMHALLLPCAVIAEVNPERARWASDLGLEVVSQPEPHSFQNAIVCPGSPSAIQTAFEALQPNGTLMLFAPSPPEAAYPFPQELAYFRDLTIKHSYSCGPDDTVIAAELIKDGKVRARDVVSHFVHLDELPEAYSQMRDGKILKAMVMFK